MEKRTTDTLIDELKQLKPAELTGYFEKYAEQTGPEYRSFSAYMRKKLKEKGIKQQEVFLAADIPEGYGYKLISEEKHTRQRDVILRLCIAAHFELREVQQALKLYGFAPLYPRIRRDSAMIVAINNGISEPSMVNELLKKYELPELYECRES